LKNGPEVEVLRASLSEIVELAPYEAALTPAETAQAKGYRLLEAKRVFILARGLLRLELARRLGCEPGDMRFDLRASGKPDLRREDEDRPDWRFSVSHTGPHAAIAFCLGLDVGLDLERLDRTVDSLAIAERYFTPREFAALRAWPEAGRSPAFFAGWTRKEAIVKARGATMAESLATLNVEIDPEALHPRYEDEPGVAPRPVCGLTSFRFDALRLIGAVAVVSDQAPRLRFGVVNGASFD
jgi:4'-phosphopantetheinyl transferase